METYKSSIVIEMRKLLIPVITGILVGSCGIIGPDGNLEIGQLIDWLDPLVVPDTVLVGRPFLVTVTTMGSGCTRVDKTEIEFQDNVATITPYDYEDFSGGDCPLVQLALHREVELRFPTVGDGQVILRGRDSSDRIVTVTRVTVVITHPITRAITSHDGSSVTRGFDFPLGNDFWVLLLEAPDVKDQCRRDSHGCRKVLPLPGPR